MPDSFPIISDPTKTTQEQESWWKNAEERMLSGSLGSKRNTDDQWLRKISLIVYKSGFNPGYDEAGSDPGTKANNQAGIDLSMLRINFSIDKQTRANPNTLYAKVYNLAPETLRQVRQYTRVQLMAGYERAQYGIVFDGTVIIYVEGKENPVDSYLEIFAGDGNEPAAHSVILQTWPPGTLPSQIAKDAIGKMPGVKVGQVKLEGEQKSVRSTSYAGQVIDLIRDKTNAYPADFFIDDGTAHIIPWTGYRDGTIVELSPTTGLIGIPKVTPQGIECQCLLNPKLRLGGLVKIDNKRLSGVPYYPGTDPNSDDPFFTPGGKASPISSAFPQRKFAYAGTSPTGIYKILLLQMTGDTRGQPWYSSMVCQAANADGSEIPGRAGSAFTRSVSESRPGGGGIPQFKGAGSAPPT